jgi:hypothetical protein
MDGRYAHEPVTDRASRRAAPKPAGGHLVSPAQYPTEGTSEPARLLFRLQRSVGNAATGALLSSGSGSLRALQRDPTAAPPNVKEFVPVMRPSPAAPTSIRLFEHHIHDWTVVNWREAPKGTQFHWGWALEQPAIFEVVGQDTDNGGVTTLIWLQSRQPGSSTLQGTPVHQVPGGPQVTGDTRRVTLTVQRPTLTLLSLMPRRADGSGAASDHLSVGDKLIVRVKVGNVEGRHMENPDSVALTGQGVDLTEMTDLSAPVQNFADGRSYDVTLTVRRPGSLNLELELGLGDMALGAGPKAAGVRGEVEMDRQEFLNSAGQCDTKIALAYTRANSIMEVLSAAYGNAYDTHDRTLRAQDASNRLVGDLILSAALAFIPGGVGGVVGGMMKNAKAGDFLVDAVKDMAKAGTRGLQTAVVGSAGGGGAMAPMSDDPRTWRAQEAVRVNTEKEHVLTVLDDWKTKARARDPNFYLNFDPATKTEASLVRAGQPLAAIPVPEQTEHQRLFELGMWREWLKAFGYTVASVPTRAGETSFPQENQGKKVRDRINALGESGDAWLETFGGVAKERAAAEAARRNKAARS